MAQTKAEQEATPVIDFGAKLEALAKVLAPHPISHTLHAISSTLHPITHTLHPKSHTLRPISHTLHLISRTLHPITTQKVARIRRAPNCHHARPLAQPPNRRTSATHTTGGKGQAWTEIVHLRSSESEFV